MLGFLGTVTGMITTFANLAEGNNAVDQLMGGLQDQCLLQFWIDSRDHCIYFLQPAVQYGQKTMFLMEDKAVEFIDLLESPSN